VLSSALQEFDKLNYLYIWYSWVGNCKAPNRIYLVLEYCAGGDLAAYIQRYGKVSEGTARHFMQQLGIYSNLGKESCRCLALPHAYFEPILWNEKKSQTTGFALRSTCFVPLRLTLSWIVLS
jgi:hypothetical protein